jgi:uncharacterized protein (TIGR03790 family)
MRMTVWCVIAACAAWVGLFAGCVDDLAVSGDVACGDGTCDTGLPPAAVDDFEAVGPEGVHIHDVRANDPGFRLGVVTVVDAAHFGTVTVQEDGRVVYTADKGFSGSDGYTYRVSRGDDHQGTATVWLTVYDQLGGLAPTVLLPRTRITRQEMAIVVNEDDPDSVAIGDYYVAQRGIPSSHVITLSLGPLEQGGIVMSPASFEAIYGDVLARTPSEIQAYVLTWTTPYRVGKMSITSAFALGYDASYESSPCALTAPVSTFDSVSTRPFTDHGIRPTMMLAGESIEDVFELIDRGVSSDNTYPVGTGYQVRTSDAARNVRWPAMLSATGSWDHLPDGLAMTYYDNGLGKGSDAITNTPDVLFYLTGMTQVSGIDTNVYLPGAVADHLTSFGGKLTNAQGQMSILRWLEAGATGSYGTVVEPCNFTEKFPDPRPLFSHYYRGQTLLGAYWKSVLQPGEGVFIGEPLASPWSSTRLRFEAGQLELTTTSLRPGVTYVLEAADVVDGTIGGFETVQADIRLNHHRRHTLVVPDATQQVYRLREYVPPDAP